jgi:MoaD family protein
MSITVNLHYPLSQIVGTSTLVMEWQGGTIRDLLEELSRRYGRKLAEELVDEHGNLEYTYRWFVTGDEIDELSARIKDGDEIQVRVPVGGG